MADFLRDDPIVTISTSTKDKCAIGIIRITGFEDLEFFYPFMGKHKSEIKPRYSHYIKILKEGTVLDDGIMLFFPAPHSYTGENLLELHLHGNPIGLKRIEEYLISSFSLMRAFPGEFTYRAYRNKKLTLAQVEGLDLILNSNTAIGIDSGLSIHNGKLYKNYIDLRDAFYRLCSAVELNIDFSEDVGEENALQIMEESFIDFDNKITFLYKQSRGSLNQLLKPEVVLFGETNAGKSTLFNKLIGDNRAIVSDTAGTTRDFISEYIFINDNAFRLIDTAGFRETSDSIETEGINRSLALRDTSFASVYVLNLFSNNAALLLEEAKSYDFVIFTHTDEADFIKKINGLNLDISDSNLFVSSKNGPIEPLCSFISGPIGPKTINGPIEPLFNAINNKYLDNFSQDTINIERHQNVINDIFVVWSQINFINDSNDLGVFSSKIELVKGSLESLIGIVAPEDVLNNIFSSFCIGK